MFAPPTDSKGRTRLLPASVPYRFFVSASIFHLLGWLLVAAEPLRLLAHSGGMGPALGALHAFTLGTLTMTAIGASLQLLPVATVQSVRSVRAAALVWWLFAPGTAILVAGLAFVAPTTGAIGAALVASALSLYAWLLAANLAAAKRQRALTLYGWAGLAGLVAVLASGPLLAIRLRFGIPELGREAAVAHMLVACYGFLGMFSVGFAYLLVPMFMVTRAPSEGSQRGVLVALLAALALAVAAVLTDAATPWRVAAGLLGMGAATVHAVQMFGVVRRRRGRDARGALALMLAAWVALPGGIALGTLAWLGVAPQVTGPLFVVLLVPGWLLCMMLAILLRIVPFLASVHVKIRSGRLPLVSSLTPAWAARALAVAHLAALATLTAGVGARSAALVRAGGWLGVLAGLVLCAFIAVVAQRARIAATQVGRPARPS